MYHISAFDKCLCFIILFIFLFNSDFIFSHYIFIHNVNGMRACFTHEAV